MIPTDILRDGRLAGRSVLVTGAGSDGDLLGTGAAMAVLFGLKGAAVTLVDVDQDRAAQTAKLLADQGIRAAVVVADITDLARCRAAVDAAVDAFGHLDGLVNNAAIAPGRREITDPEGTWGPVLELNLTAAQSMCSAALPHLIAAGRSSIVNITSAAALRGFATPAYSASKAGLIGLTKSLAFLHGRAGVRVNCVAPGHIHTPMGYRDAALTGRELRRRASMLGVEGTAWDVGFAALFLLSDEARFITATVLPVDAGATETVPLGLYHAMADDSDERPQG